MTASEIWVKSKQEALILVRGKRNESCNRTYKLKYHFSEEKETKDKIVNRQPSSET